MRNLVVVIAAALVVSLVAADELPGAKPIPAVEVEPLPEYQVIFRHRGRELTRYHFEPHSRRPFLYPIMGPSGLSLTRLGHPHDPVTHSHHNSVWISHHIVDGVNFWGDQGTNIGRIAQQRIEQFTDGDDSASLLAVNHWNKGTETLLVERRRIEVFPAPDDQQLIVLDLQFTAEKRPITFGKSSFGLIGVRMRKSIGVHDGGGQIRNSEGAVGEKGTTGDNGVFWKPARWCDYSGPVTDKAIEGITLFDHPTNPNHPTVFHVRDDGWMGASLTFDADRTIEVGKPLRLRYGLYVHGGLPPIKELDVAWKNFADLPVPKSLEPSKKK